MFMDTGECVFGQIFERGAGKEKGRVKTRPVGTSLRFKVSLTVSSSYFGWAVGAFGAAGAVVAGLVADGVVGLAVAGLAGAATPDCAL